MTEKIYLETLRNVLGGSIFHYLRANALNFRLAFLHKLLAWLSNFNSWSIVIPKRTGIDRQTINHGSSCFYTAHEITYEIHEVAIKPSKEQ